MVDRRVAIGNVQLTFIDEPLTVINSICIEMIPVWCNTGCGYTACHFDTSVLLALVHSLFLCQFQLPQRVSFQRK